MAGLIQRTESRQVPPAQSGAVFFNEYREDSLAAAHRCGCGVLESFAKQPHRFVAAVDAPVVGVAVDRRRDRRAGVKLLRTICGRSGLTL
jgi:hypothetical protein